MDHRSGPLPKSKPNGAWKPMNRYGDIGGDCHHDECGCTIYIKATGFYRTKCEMCLHHDIEHKQISSEDLGHYQIKAAKIRKTLSKDIFKETLSTFNAPSIDPIELNLIIGYVKQYIFNTSITRSILIPIEMYQIIAMFYGGYDNFDRNNLARCHIINGNLVQQYLGFCTLNTVIFRKAVRTGRHCWKFRVYGDASGIDIGIWKVNSGDPPINKWFVKNKNGYCFRVRTRDKWYGNDWTGYGKSASDNDVVTMYFDADDLTLSFSVKDEYCGIAFIVERSVYKAAICTYTPGASIEFIEYNAYIY